MAPVQQAVGPHTAGMLQLQGIQAGQQAAPWPGGAAHQNVGTQGPAGCQQLRARVALLDMPHHLKPGCYGFGGKGPDLKLNTTCSMAARVDAVRERAAVLLCGGGGLLTSRLLPVQLG
jgi:hypothetical protein